MKKIVIVFILFTLAAVAEVIDYRGFFLNLSPDKFGIDLSNYSQNTVYKFYKTNNLLWESDNIIDYAIYDDEIFAILTNDTIELKDNLCGGLVAPKDAISISYSDDFLKVSSIDKHYLYYVPECAQYVEIENYGVTAVISSGFDFNAKALCETGYEYRAMRDYITGEFIYIDDINSISTIGINDNCYFLNYDGTIDIVGKGSSKNESIVVLGMDLGEYIYSATSFSGSIMGFSGFTPNRSFQINLSETGAIDVSFEDLPDGVCLHSENTEKPFCVAEQSNIINQVYAAEKLSKTQTNLLFLENNVLKAYDTELNWSRSYMNYSTPYGCVDDFNNFYISDVLNRVYALNAGSLSEINAFPEICGYNEIYYHDGVFYNSYDDEIYKYADIVEMQARSVLFKVEHLEEIIFFVELR